MRTSLLAVLVLSAAALLGVAALTSMASTPPTKRDAEQMRQKLLVINTNALSPSSTPRRTRVTEPEVNAYLIFDAKEQLPKGVVDPGVIILGDGRVSGRAIVDLDAVKRERQSSGAFDPINLLGGRLPVSVTGILHSKDGMARFELESAEVSGVRVPQTALQQLLTYYSRTHENPDGLRLDDPFPLPARIRRIEVGKGEAVVVQ